MAHALKISEQRIYNWFRNLDIRIPYDKIVDIIEILSDSKCDINPLDLGPEYKGTNSRLLRLIRKDKHISLPIESINTKNLQCVMDRGDRTIIVDQNYFVICGFALLEKLKRDRQKIAQVMILNTDDLLSGRTKIKDVSAKLLTSEKLALILYLEILLPETRGKRSKNNKKSLKSDVFTIFKTGAEIAHLFGFGRNKYLQAKIVYYHAVSKLMNAINCSQISINKASDIVKQSLTLKPEQRDAKQLELLEIENRKKAYLPKNPQNSKTLKEMA